MGKYQTYSTSIVFKRNEKYNKVKTVLGDKVELCADKNAVKTYLENYNLNEVMITVEMEETLVQSDDGDFYQLDFTFGPSYCYFDKPLELKIGGKYKKTGYEIYLCGSAGNQVESAPGEDKFEIYDFGLSDEFYYDPSWEFAASYYDSVEVKKGQGGQIQINEEAKIKIQTKSLDTYLEEQGIDSVEITVDMYYGWDGGIWFVFGPSGAHFDPELELEIKGGYIIDDILLTGEDGEFLEFKADKNGTKLTFYIPHFSEYYYDDYDY